MPWSLYIVRCRRGELYTGVTANLGQRIKDHNRGKGCGYTAHRRPVTLIYSEPHPDRSSAQKRETQIKGWSWRKKEQLFRGFGPRSPASSSGTTLGLVML